MKEEIFYFDADGNPCDSKDAVRAVIRELDKNGELIQETFALINTGK